MNIKIVLVLASTIFLLFRGGPARGAVGDHSKVTLTAGGSTGGIERAKFPLNLLKRWGRGLETDEH